MNRWRPTGASVVESPEIDLIDIASPNDTHAEIAIAAAKAGKMVMCEKPLGRNAAEGGSHGEGRGSRGRAQHGLVQLPPRARRHAGQATDRRRTPGPHLPLPREVPAGLDHLDRPAAGRRRPLAARRRGRRQRRDRRSAGALHRYRDVAERRHRRSDRRPPRPSSRAASTISPARWSRSASTTPASFWRASTTARWPPSKPPATRAATRRSTRSKSTARTRPSCWDLHDLHRLQYFDHRDEGRLRGWRSIHITDGDHPYMKHWWVPGLQIGYEHTFIHQAADFLTRRRGRQERGAHVPRRAAHRLRDRCRPGVGGQTAIGSRSASPQEAR